jgi:hypothetical protein
MAMIGGCAAQEAKNQAFFPAQEHQAVVAAADVQAVNGAREDGMLRAVHFDGDQLNALGKQKLDLMATGTGQGDLTVYVNVPGAASADKDHHQVIVAYLEDQGLKADQIHVKDGANPNAMSSADAGLSRLSKTENPGAPDGHAKPDIGESGMTMEPGSMSMTP